MTKFPSWDAIREGTNVLELVFSDEAERTAIQEAYGWIYEGAVHRDEIYALAEELGD